MKKLLWFLAFFLPAVVLAQTSSPISPFYFKGATSIYPINNSSTLTLPALLNATCTGTNASGTLIVGSCTGGAGATTTINGVSGPTFTVASTTYLNIIASGTVFTFYNLGVTSTAGNWAGTWQNTNSSTFYLASNPSGYVTSTNASVGPSTSTYVAFFNTSSTITGNPNLLFGSSTLFAVKKLIVGTSTYLNAVTEVLRLVGGGMSIHDVPTNVVEITATNSTGTVNLGVFDQGPQSSGGVPGGTFLDTYFTPFYMMGGLGNNIGFTLYENPSGNGVNDNNVGIGIGSSTPVYLLTVGTPTSSIFSVSSTGAVNILSSNLVDAGGNKYVTSTSAGVTSLSAGTGITLSPNPITSTGTITNTGVTSLMSATGTLTISTSTASGAFDVTRSGTTINVKIPSNLGFFTNDPAFVTFASSGTWTSAITHSATTTFTGNVSTTVANALVLGNASGTLTAYGGASACGAGNAVTTISATGATTCSAFLTGNQSITFTASGDATGTTSGATSLTPSLTITGLQGKLLPALATGTLKYTAGAWTMDNTNYLSSYNVSSANSYISVSTTTNSASLTFSTSSFGSNAFNSTAIPTNYYQTINGSTASGAGTYNIYAGGVLSVATGTASTTISFSTTSLDQDVSALKYVTSTATNSLAIFDSNGKLGAYAGSTLCPGTWGFVNQISPTGTVSCDTVTPANPTALVGTSAVNGSSANYIRSDSAPAINQAATFAFSALGNTTSTANISAASMKINGDAVVTSTCMAPNFQVFNVTSSPAVDQMFWTPSRQYTITSLTAVNSNTAGNQMGFNIIWSTSTATASSSAYHLFASNVTSTATTTVDSYPSLVSFASTTVSANSIVRLVTDSNASTTNWGFSMCYK